MFEHLNCSYSAIFHLLKYSLNVITQLSVIQNSKNFSCFNCWIFCWNIKRSVIYLASFSYLKLYSVKTIISKIHVMSDQLLNTKMVHCWIFSYFFILHHTLLLLLSLSNMLNDYPVWDEIFIFLSSLSVVPLTI